MDPSAVGGSPVELLYRRTGGGQEAANESALTQQLGVATDRVSLLENLTQLLDQDGTYYEYVNAVQVWSHHCDDGEEAAWENLEGYVELSCPAAVAPRMLERRSRRILSKPGSPFSKISVHRDR